MEITLRKLKKLNVYEKGKSEPVGKVKSICFSKEKNNVDALYVETLSLIPLSKKVFIEEFGEISGDKLFLKEEISDKNISTSREEDVSEDKVLGVYEKKREKQKLYDVSFDFETGRIRSMTLKNGLFSKNNKIEIKDMHIENNVIYIE